MAHIEEEKLRENIEQERSVSFWGQNYKITPRLVGERFGDGKRLIALSPIMTRPDYYVVRIDSSWNLDNHGDGDLLIDHMDDVYCAIEDEYGTEYDCDEDGEALHESEFPVLKDGGCQWWEIDWPTASPTDGEG